MKLPHYQLEQHLSKQLAPAYVISGDELFLKNEAVSLIRKTAKREGFSERIRIAPEAGYNWEQLYSQLYANSLLAEKRLIELDFRDSLPPKTASAILQAYAEKPAPDTVLLIDISKIDDKIAKSGWYKSLDKIAMMVAVWPIPREQLPQWIMQRIKKYKLQINPDAANLLADCVEGNLIAAAQTIEKLYLLKPAQPIDSQLVASILTDESRFTIFDFIEHLFAGQQQRALHILEYLRQDGIEPVLILWAITRELRLLADMSAQHKQGHPMDAIFQKFRVFAKRQQTVRAFLNKYNAEYCWQQLTHAAHIDNLIKGAAAGNAWDALQLFCLRF